MFCSRTLVILVYNTKLHSTMYSLTLYKDMFHYFLATVYHASHLPVVWNGFLVIMLNM